MNNELKLIKRKTYGFKKISKFKKL
ncbi:hypothetical protein [cyanobacterium endosymbiont of Rhopalodia gibberula]